MPAPGRRGEKKDGYFLVRLPAHIDTPVYAISRFVPVYLAGFEFGPSALTASPRPGSVAQRVEGFSEMGNRPVAAVAISTPELFGNAKRTLLPAELVGLTVVGGEAKHVELAGRVHLELGEGSRFRAEILGEVRNGAARHKGGGEDFAVPRIELQRRAGREFHHQRVTILLHGSLADSRMGEAAGKRGERRERPWGRRPRPELGVRCRSRSELAAGRSRAVLQSHGRSLGRPRAAGPDAADRLLLLDPLRAPACREVELNLAYRWFCRLGLEDRVPHHSTFSVNRHGRFRDSDVLRQAFESIVRRCMEMGLVGGEGFAVDASVIEANVSRFQRVEGSEVEWTDAQRASRPVRAYLAALDSEHAPTTPERKPKALSPSDPAAAWTTRGRHR